MARLVPAGCAFNKLKLPMASIVPSVNAFDNDRKVPGVADPTEILPAHHGLLKSGADIGVQHCSLPGNDDIWKLHQPTIGDEARQPSGFCQKLIHKRQHPTKFAGQ